MPSSDGRRVPARRPGRQPGNLVSRPVRGASAAIARAVSTKGGRRRCLPMGGLLLLVVLSDKLVKELDSERGGALWHGRGILGRPCRPRDIEVRPRDIVYKALDKLSANNASRGATA